MTSDGFVAVARGCKVASKDMFNNQQGQPVYMLTLIGACCELGPDYHESIRKPTQRTL